MTIHISRDFLTNVTTFPSATMYLASAFMIGVLGFTQVGQTIFNMSGSGAWIASGVSASLNFGSSGSFSALAVASSSYVVSASDIGRIVALKSTLNPRHNSGLFRVSGVDVPNNRFVLEYRSPDNPPVETNTLNWTLFFDENRFTGLNPFNANGGPPNGLTGYQGDRTYGSKRIILQSPHSSSWQVRFCHESTVERANHGVGFSVAPGFDGNAIGDFPTASLDVSKYQARHLHGPQFYNSSTGFRGTLVGINNTGSPDISPNARSRFYAWGDDSTGTTIIVTRNFHSYSNGWFSFGFADNDTPPDDPMHRLFVMGKANFGTSDVTWENGYVGSGSAGIAFGIATPKPIHCVATTYDYMSSMGTRINNGLNSANGPMGESLAVDSVLLGSAELQRPELWAGTRNSYDLASGGPTVCMPYEPRRMGLMPMARLGRMNFLTCSLTTDPLKAWMHFRCGVFFPWEGPNVYL